MSTNFHSVLGTCAASSLFHFKSVGPKLWLVAANLRVFSCYSPVADPERFVFQQRRSHARSVRGRFVMLYLQRSWKLKYDLLNGVSFVMRKKVNRGEG